MNDVGILVWTQLWQVTLVILLVGFVSLRWGRRYPHLTYLLWMLVIVKTIVPPILSSPASMFSWLDTAASAWPEPVERNVLEPDSYVPDPYGANRSVAELPPHLMNQNGQLANPNSAHLSPALQPSVASSTSFLTWLRMNPLMVLLVMWAAGVIALFASTMLHWVRFWRTLHEHTIATPEWLESLAKRVQFSLRMKRKFRIIVNTQGVGPLVYGVIRPSLVIPEEMLAVERRRRLEPVIAHEMIHARRGDTLFGLVQFLAQLMWWFHPLVWWANREANRCCEQCCDEEAVAGLRCRPEEYAHALLDVLELRRHLRAVPVLNGLKTKEVTVKRLEALVFRKKGFALRAPRWNWAILLIAALLVIPGARIVKALDEEASKPSATYVERALRSKADSEFQNGRWNQAVESYKVLLHQDAGDARSWFRMAYALHASGRTREAMAAHEKAASFPQTRAIATYNWACALALLGREDAAMEKLEEAIEVGFRSQLPIQNDTDLAALADRPHFKTLAARAMPEGEPMAYTQFDFWIGEWNVLNNRGEIVRTNKVTKDEQGLVLLENWDGSDGSAGSSICIYDTENECWKYTWIDKDGSIIDLVGGYEDGKMILAGDRPFENGVLEMNRTMFAAMPNGMIRQKTERSFDNGTSWEIYHEFIYERKRGSNVKPFGSREEVSVDVIR